MPITIGLMGFGRIGRNLFRILSRSDDIRIGAISDIADPEATQRRRADAAAAERPVYVLDAAAGDEAAARVAELLGRRKAVLVEGLGIVAAGPMTVAGQAASSLRR